LTINIPLEIKAKPKPIETLCRSIYLSAIKEEVQNGDSD